MSRANSLVQSVKSLDQSSLSLLLFFLFFFFFFFFFFAFSVRIQQTTFVFFKIALYANRFFFFFFVFFFLLLFFFFFFFFFVVVVFVVVFCLFVFLSQQDIEGPFFAESNKNYFKISPVKLANRQRLVCWVKIQQTTD